MSAHVPAMTCVPVSRSAFPAKGSLNMHRHTDVPSHIDKGGLLSNLSEDIGVVVELDPESIMLVGENGHPNLDKADVLLPAAVHQLLSRQEMLRTPEAMNAVMKEAEGLEAKGTWDKTTVREQEAIKD